MSASANASETENTYPNAPLWKKFAALVYDYLVLAAVSMGYGALALLVQVKILQKTFNEGELGDFGPAGFFGWVLVIFAFYCYFWRRGGQTLGMRAWRLKILTQDDEKPGWSHCIIRSIVAPLSLAAGLLGYFWQLVDPSNLTLHDRLSKTKIVQLPKRKK
ncbi:RDD family protein [Sessilibacter corallicola]|uniref:RDD family protein n=1 Tax=Sessilibacter corallicola TaxID=2904075 RepID=A0ABQ0AB35_9GAMM|nr:RDD family protein [Sessilibacter corallicola]MCE2028206.1 RDD family protein [Sessilibacter corallicola]